MGHASSCRMVGVWPEYRCSGCGDRMMQIGVSYATVRAIAGDYDEEFSEAMLQKVVEVFLDEHASDLEHKDGRVGWMAGHRR
jgi:hypothetical protein